MIEFILSWLKLAACRIATAPQRWDGRTSESNAFEYPERMLKIEKEGIL